MIFFRVFFQTTELHDRSYHFALQLWLEVVSLSFDCIIGTMIMKLPKIQWFVEEFFFRSSWVVFFIFICLMVYEKNIEHYQLELDDLQIKVTGLNNEKEQAQILNESLKLKVQNQDDPAWVNLVLMEELGLVPIGQQKVIFKRNAEQIP
jgi:hypothetical protein